MKVAIYGTGALGSVIGAGLINGGINIDLIDNDEQQVEAIRKNGIHIIGGKETTVKPNIMYPQEMAPAYDIILLCTKITENNELVPLLKDHLKEDGVIVSLQDGLPEKYISEIVGPQRTMGCTVEWGATLVEPGVCEITSHPDYLSVHVGKMPGVPSGRAMEVRNMLNKVCRVHYENNLIGARWTKLLINCSLSVPNAIIGGTFGDVFDGPKKNQNVCLEAMKECIKVGHAEGAKLSSVQGEDFVKDFYYYGPITKAIARKRLPYILRNHRNIRSAVLQDVQKGRPSEEDAINGYIVECGKKHGIETPVNAKILEIVHKIQKGDLKIDANNIELLF